MWNAPSYDRSILQDSSKRIVRGLNLLYALQLILNFKAVATTLLALPQVVTEPFCRIAANSQIRQIHRLSESCHLLSLGRPM
jgi:hypothetical protein